MDTESTPKIDLETRTAEEGAARAEMEIRAILKRLLKNRRGNRTEIAEQLTALTGVKVSMAMLNDWCSTSKKGLRFPLSLARAVCEIMGNDELAFAAMPDDLRERAELGKRAVEARDLLRKMADQADALAGRKRPRSKRR